MENINLLMVIAFAPLVGCLIAGLFGKYVGRKGAQWAAILGVGISFIGSLIVLKNYAFGGAQPVNIDIYTWLTLGGIDFSVGFMIDSLSAMMLVVVTGVSLMVHIYTIGYMHDDPGYQRFFSYISLFTFSMLMLLMSNNFIQLFFGWEAVGLVSYLLIGFWFKRPTAIFANLKAFLMNRVGDMGFVLGIGLVLAYFGGSLNYQDVFANVDNVVGKTVTLFPGWSVDVITATCVFLFIGAMAKSAQFPLHTWLPDSMEGPTPISALIHAATMVTAGIFMVSRMSPIFEHSDWALGLVMVAGTITALFMGFLGMVQNDIKRVIAYSTLSQLGYMTVALGVSAYSVAMFHVMTHAFFKALLFLAAGSVIIGMHHDQDMRNMGGLRKYMPITWITLLLGNLSLIGTPFFSGFYSKESIIEAVKFSTLPGSGFAYWALVISVFVTAFYSFRLYFMVFHGKEKWRERNCSRHDENGEHLGLEMDKDPHESPWVVTIPLILLAIPSVIIGWMTVDAILYGDFLKNSIYVNSAIHPAMSHMAQEWHGPVAMVLHGFTSLPFWLALAGVVLTWWLYTKRTDIPAKIKSSMGPVYKLLENKYYLDALYIGGFAAMARGIGKFFWKVGDVAIIDTGIVNGAAKVVGAVSKVTRKMQTGYLNNYAAIMVFGLLVLVMWWCIPLILK